MLLYCATPTPPCEISSNLDMIPVKSKAYSFKAKIETKFNVTLNAMNEQEANA